MSCVTSRQNTLVYNYTGYCIGLGLIIPRQIIKQYIIVKPSSIPFEGLQRQLFNCKQPNMLFTQSLERRRSETSRSTIEVMCKAVAEQVMRGKAYSSKKQVRLVTIFEPILISGYKTDEPLQIAAVKGYSRVYSIERYQHTVYLKLREV